MDFQDIIYEKKEGIATITLNRPEQRNAFTPVTAASISQAIDDTAKDDKVRVLVITGSGQAFCAGRDVKDMAHRVNYPSSRGRETGLVQLPLLLYNLEKPVIAAINGVAAGGGLDLALACDIRIASDKARFTEVFMRRGGIPAMGGVFFLPRLVGLDKACQLIWTGDIIDAKEAERIGLVTMVVPHEEVVSATRELAEKLAMGPPLAIQGAKRALHEGLKMDLATSLEYVVSILKVVGASEDYKEGVKAFLEKREPIFKGK